MPTPGLRARILSRKALLRAVHRPRGAGARVVWTNGCFDVLHAGHVELLTAARELGDLLVVGVNSDASLRAIKGPDRPINPARERARVLAALRPVDFVTVFRGRRPLSVLRELRPHVYAKGGNYDLDTIDTQERRLVERYGGEIRFLPLVKGRSTTALIDRIVSAHCRKDRA